MTAGMHSSAGGRDGGKPLTFALLWLFTVSFPIIETLSASVLTAGTKPLAAATAGIWLIETFAKSGRIRFARTTGLVIGLVTWSAMTVFWSITPSVSLERSLQLFLAGLFFCIVVDVCRSLRDIRRLMFAYLIGVAILAGAGLPAILAGTTYGGLYNRFSALGADPNNFGIMLASSVPIALVIGLTARSRARGILLLLAIPVAVALIVSTASRSALAAVALVALGYVATHVRRRGIHRLIAAISVLAILAVPAYFAVSSLAPEPAVKRLSETIGRSNQDKRRQLWEHAFALSLERPLLGHGSGAFVELSKEVEREGQPVHNSYLSFLVETGIPGAMLWLLLWVAHAKMLFRIKAEPAATLANGLLLALIAVFVAAMTLNWEIRKPVYLLWGLTVALVAQTSREEEERAVPESPTTLLVGGVRV